MASWRKAGFPLLVAACLAPSNAWAFGGSIVSQVVHPASRPVSAPAAPPAPASPVVSPSLGDAMGSVLSSGSVPLIAASEGVVELNGNSYYRTASGHLYPPSNGPVFSPSAPDPGAFYGNYQPTGAKIPSSVTLPITAVEDQGPNGGCWGFADIAAVEAEYLNHYGLTLGLSEQYFISNIHHYYGNVTNAPGDFALVSYYGLVPRALFPYDPSTPALTLPLVLGGYFVNATQTKPMTAVTQTQTQVTMNVANQSSTAQYAAIDNVAINSFTPSVAIPINLTQTATIFTGSPYTVNDFNIQKAAALANTSQIAADLANYNSFSMAPLAVQEAAQYAPTHGEWLGFLPDDQVTTFTPCKDLGAAIYGVTDCGQSLSPLEEVLASGHVIRLETDVTYWHGPDQDGGVFTYQPKSPGDGGHVVVIYGYNRVNQTFSIKNSWGAGWNGTGTALLSYYLVKRAGWNMSFIDGLRPPSAGVIGSGVWSGFWMADFGNGNTGVAVLRHAYPGQQVLLGNQGNDVGDYFYSAQDPTHPSQLPPLQPGIDMETVTFGTQGLHFRLDRTQGSTSATFTNLGTNLKTSWYRCNPSMTGSYTVAPADFPSAAKDPYVLPPCGFSWKTGYSQCKTTADKYIPTNQVTLNDYSEVDSVAPGVCVSPSTEKPDCPNNDLVVNGSENSSDSIDWCGGGSVPLCSGTVSLSGAGLPSETVAPAYITSVVNTSGGWPMPLPWVSKGRLVVDGPDQCFSSLYTSPGLTCPSGQMSPNGDGCWKVPLQNSVLSPINVGPINLLTK